MKKIIIKSLFLVAVLVAASPVFADTSVHLDIETNSGQIFNDNIIISPCDSDNDPATADIASAYCAILQSGLSNDWSWFGDDAFLNSLDSVANDNVNSIYWAWFSNLNVGQIALNKYLPADGDSILLEWNIAPLKMSVSSLTPNVGDTITITAEQSDYNSTYAETWSPADSAKLIIGSDTFDFDSNGTYSLTLTEAQPLTIKAQKAGFVDSAEITITPVNTISTHHRSGGSNAIEDDTEQVLGASTQKTFDLNKALKFLVSNQKEDGSFGGALYTDWVTLSLASNGSYGKEIIKLNKYFSSNKTNLSLLPDYERHAMALMALGFNPRSTLGQNYISKILESFDGIQFGDIQEDNDDIFALIVLQNAGYTFEDAIIQKDIAFILKTQNKDGSWNASVDMTGAGIEALAKFEKIAVVSSAISRAEDYLKVTQKENGGWNDSASSTAWAIEGILSLRDMPEEWKNNGNTPLDFLATLQDDDGGIHSEDNDSRVWETAYVTSALSRMAWNQIMQNFDKSESLIKETIPPSSAVTVPKTVARKITVTKNENKKEEEVITPQVDNTALAINAVPDISSNEKPAPEEQKGWFARLWDRLFGN